MNPNLIINSMLKNNPAIKDNPIMQNAFNMAQRGDTRGLEQLVQNVANSKGIDINKLKQDVMKQFGM